jgi:hypothetical protein
VASVRFVFPVPLHRIRDLAVEDEGALGLLNSQPRDLGLRHAPCGDTDEKGGVDGQELVHEGERPQHVRKVDP